MRVFAKSLRERSQSRSESTLREVDSSQQTGFSVCKALPDKFRNAAQDYCDGWVLNTLLLNPVQDLSREEGMGA